MKRILAGLFALMVSLPVVSAAQFLSNDVTVNMSVNVVAPALEVTAIRDMVFPTITTSHNKTITTTTTHDSPDAAFIQVLGLGLEGQGRAFTATFYLPTTLDFGPNTIDIVGWNARWTNDQNLGGGTLFDPTTPENMNTGPDGETNIFVGASIQTNGGEVAGTYTATFTMETIYF